MLRAARPLLRRARLARALHIEAHTIEHPTPELVSSLITPHATAYFSLSTSLQPESLSPLVAALPKHSVGGFHISDIPSISIALITPDAGETVETFHDPSEGRAPVQVGKWQRGTAWTDDKRGSAVGELEKILGGEGWEGVWRGEETGAGVSLPKE